MKIAIHYRDGSYCMYDPSKRRFADGVDPDVWMADNTIDIPDSVWRLYLEFLEHDRFWQQTICSYDNMIHDRKEKRWES